MLVKVLDARVVEEPRGQRSYPTRVWLLTLSCGHLERREITFRQWPPERGPRPHPRDIEDALPPPRKVSCVTCQHGPPVYQPRESLSRPMPVGPQDLRLYRLGPPYVVAAWKERTPRLVELVGPFPTEAAAYGYGITHYPGRFEVGGVSRPLA